MLSAVLLLRHSTRRSMPSSQSISSTTVCHRPTAQETMQLGRNCQEELSLPELSRAQNESTCPCQEPVLRAPAVEEKRSHAPGDIPAPAWHRVLCKEVQCSSHHQMVLLHAALQGHGVQGCFDSWKKILNWGCFSAAWVSGE